MKSKYWTVFLACSFLVCASAGGVEVKSGHPRVMLTGADIQRAAANIRAGDTNWQVLKSRIDAGSAPAPAYGLVYHATGEKEVGAKGVEKLMAARTVEEISLGYDWLFDLLSDQQRDALYKRIAKLVEREVSRKMSSPWTNFVQRSTYRAAVAGAAFAQEYPEAKAWIEKAHADWKGFHLPAALITGEGGGWPEGTLYSYIVYNNLAKLADVFWTATDTNIYEDTPWFSDRLVWWRFHVWPLPKNFGGRYFYMYHPYGDSERWRAPMQNQEIAAELRVMRYLGEAERVKEWRWFMRQLGGPIASPGQWEVLAYYDAGAPEKKPTELSWICPGTGQVFIRSSWDDDATWIAYQCGPRFTYHQHVDQGTFSIFKLGDLTGESGVYEPHGPTEEDGHLQAYSSRAIAHNTINIYNPVETFAGYRSGNSPRNDGGQRMWKPFSNTATSAEYWDNGLDSGAYDTGRIIEFKDTGFVVYIASDLTGAYNSANYVSGNNTAKVSEVTRQLVYFRPQEEGEPEALVVFDRVRTTDPSFEVRTLFQTANDVRVAGEETKLDESEYHYDGDLAQTDVGGGRLFMRFVHPEESRITRLAAPGKYHWIYGKNYPVANTPWERGYGSGRIEVLDTEKTTDHYFLTVLFPADKSETEAPIVRKLAGKAFIAIPWGDPRIGKKYLVEFATEGEMGAFVAKWDERVVNVIGPWAQYGNTKGLFADPTVAGENTTAMEAPRLRSVEVTNVTTEAVVSWKTEEPTAGYAEFGPDKNMRHIIEGPVRPSTDHALALRGLEPERTYYVRAAAVDENGNTAFSPMMTLQTPPDKTPPAISEIATAIHPTDVTLSFSTDDRAEGVVSIRTPGADDKSFSTPFGIDHRITIDGLKPNTSYAAAIVARNSSGLSSRSGPFRFTTGKLMAGFFETRFDGEDIGPFESTTGGAWKLWEDSAGAGQVLALSNEARARTQLVYTGHEYSDFTLCSKARTLEGGGNSFRDYAIVFGYQDENNYYAAWFSGGVDDSIPGIVRVKDGDWELIGTRPNLVTLQDRDWHDIKVVRRGSNIEVYFDAALAFEADDSTFGSGKVGFGSNNDSAAFASMKVLPLAEGPVRGPKTKTKRLTVEGLVKE